MGKREYGLNNFVASRWLFILFSKPGNKINTHTQLFLLSCIMLVFWKVDSTQLYIEQITYLSSKMAPNNYMIVSYLSINMVFDTYAKHQVNF